MPISADTPAEEKQLHEDMIEALYEPTFFLRMVSHLERLEFEVRVVFLHRSYVSPPRKNAPINSVIDG